MGKSGALYFDFQTYLRQGEPSQREKAIVWSTAMVRYVYKTQYTGKNFIAYSLTPAIFTVQIYTTMLPVLL